MLALSSALISGHFSFPFSARSRRVPTAEAALRLPERKLFNCPRRSETSPRDAKGEEGGMPKKREYLPEIINR